MPIKKDDKSHIVELEGGSRWQIWPGDILKPCNGCRPPIPMFRK
jgi:hypothetical protein